ncbi:CDP-glycerol:glycerophosphate glycerophosphotransferase [Glutamicibacter protophormiae]|uniref:CDP-glycerol:glycerophosphate glycerophosphotransferase n=1 Tax=Glutamicibacter protophormiae TaxID=37930 RepID=UPI003A903EAF
MNKIPPLFTIISAVYNVAEYLPRYLDSIAAQTIQHDKLELILVIDGSLDTSEQIIREWALNSTISTKIITKENGGQASARNRGLDVAQGEWLTFCDPDDFLAADYFSQLEGFIENNQNVSIIASRLVSYHEDRDEFRHDHPLEKRFHKGTRVVDLNSQPNFFHMHGPTSIVRRANVRSRNLKFNESLRFSFEDAHFVASYILNLATPSIGYCTEAHYYYRKRQSGDSAVQTSKLREEKYTQILVDGHLDLIKLSTRISPRLPDWLQHLLIYDILWYFRGDRRVGAPSRFLSTDIKQKFHSYISEILDHISIVNIHAFDSMPTDWDLRYALILGYKDFDYGVPRVYAMEIDADRSLTLLRYVYKSDAPDELVVYKGQVRKPTMVSSRAVKFFDRVMFHHRFVWIPARGRFSLELDGRPAPLELKGPTREKFEIRPYSASVRILGYDLFSDYSPKNAPIVDLDKIVRHSEDDSARQAHHFLSRFGIFKSKVSSTSLSNKVQSFDSKSQEHLDFFDVHRASKYKDAWVFMDRPERANDNAEHLYREILQKHKDINAWFILKRDSSDWERLSNEGFRLLPYGEVDYFAALIRSVVFASSHMDKYISDPLPDELKKYKRWKFVFLQHGITKDDLSSWFNSKDISLLITSTRDEYRSIVDPESNYRFGSKEVELTGFPRHDSLMGHHFTQPTWILLSPTWRDWLFTTDVASGSRTLIPDFASSDFAKNWHQVLQSKEILFAAKSKGLEVAFLPHPFLEPYLDNLDIPEHVRILRWSELPFAEILARTALLITDYSSTAFEAAYINTPVVYFQFDKDLVLNGAHTYERGYFNYKQDGFGPCVHTSDKVVEAVISLFEDGEDLLYIRRKHETFKYRDRNNSKRVVSAIRKRIQPESVGRILK